MSETLYRKIGRRYERVSEFHTNPAEGVWLVYSSPGCSTKRFVCRISDLPEDGQKLLGAEMRHDEIAGIIAEGRYKSAWDVAEQVIKALLCG